MDDASAPAEIEKVALQLDLERRRVEAAIATYASRVDQTAAFVPDGHRSVKTWGKASCNWSGAEAARFAKLGHAFQLLPLFAEASRAGEIGVAQGHAVAQVVANPRVREYLAAAEQLLIDNARRLEHDHFVIMLHQWERLADADGDDDRHERANRSRRAHLSLSAERMYLDAVGGVAHGVQLQEILDLFTEREWQQEWADGVARYGQLMNPSRMERTPSQRRFDGLIAMSRAAAGSDEAGGEVTVNIIVDQATFEHELARAAGADPEPLAPATVEDRRCESDRGVVLHPGEVLAAAMVGHVRRMILAPDGVVLDFGRRKRLFTGSLREAILLSERSCIWPGCDRPSSQCEADHTIPHSHGGPSSSPNGGVLCARHNLWKSRGFATARGPTGQWEVHRFDGTIIGWREHISTLRLQRAG